MRLRKSWGTKLQFSESSGTKLQFSETATVSATVLLHDCYSVVFSGESPALQCRLLRRTGFSGDLQCHRYSKFDRRFGSLPVVKKFRKKYFRNLRNETFPTAYTKIVSAEKTFRPKLRKSLSGVKPKLWYHLLGSRHTHDTNHTHSSRKTRTQKMNTRDLTWFGLIWPTSTGN